MILGGIVTKFPGSRALARQGAPGNRRRQVILLAILFVCAMVGYVIVDHDDAWYTSTIAVITEIQTEHTETQNGVSIGKENYYVQTITARLTNGARKGETIGLSNQYTDSGVRDECYQIGDKLFVEPGGDGETGKIIGQKRDTLVYLLAAALLIGMLAVAGVSGLLATLSLVFNIALLTIALLSGWLEYLCADRCADSAVYHSFADYCERLESALCTRHCGHAAVDCRHCDDLFDCPRVHAGTAISNDGIRCCTG